MLTVTTQYRGSVVAALLLYGALWYVEYRKVLSHSKEIVDWKSLDVNFHTNDSCCHGGDFFESIGVTFDDLLRKNTVINADVLDAWFDPAPSVSAAFSTHLPRALKTSPPSYPNGCAVSWLTQEVFARTTCGPACTNMALVAILK